MAPRSIFRTDDNGGLSSAGRVQASGFDFAAPHDVEFFGGLFPKPRIRRRSTPGTAMMFVADRWTP